MASLKFPLCGSPPLGFSQAKPPSCTLAQAATVCTSWEVEPGSSGCKRTLTRMLHAESSSREVRRRVPAFFRSLF